MTAPIEPTKPGELRVAVITPYCRETLDFLQQAHDSVRAQTYPCTHILIADGHPQKEVANWPVQHIVLPQRHADYGNTPRAIGSLSAMTQGFDAIAYLDADNWYHTDHIETMVDLQRLTGADVCSAIRSIHRLDGTVMFVDEDESDGERFVDTNCMFFHRPAFHVLPFWSMMPPQLGVIDDLVIWRIVRAHQFKTAHASLPTVAYRTSYWFHYARAGEPAPSGARSHEDFVRAFRWWSSLSDEVRGKWTKYMGFSSLPTA